MRINTTINCYDTMTLLALEILMLCYFSFTLFVSYYFCVIIFFVIIFLFALGGDIPTPALLTPFFSMLCTSLFICEQVRTGTITGRALATISARKRPRGLRHEMIAAVAWTFRSLLSCWSRQ